MIVTETKTDDDDDRANENQVVEDEDDDDDDDECENEEDEQDEEDDHAQEVSADSVLIAYHTVISMHVVYEKIRSKDTNLIITLF